MLKKTLVSIFVLAMFVPNISFAAPVATAHYQALLKQIEVLTKEVHRLQAILAERQKDSTVFVPTTSEIQYKVVNGKLTRSVGAKPNPTHQQLFDQLKSVIGSRAVDTYITEYRVGYVRDASLENYIEGYVKLIPEDDTWVLTLRRDGTEPLNNEERKLFNELFVHEYAHVLAHYEAVFSTTFTARFWNTVSYNASKRVNRLYEQNGYGALEDALRGQEASFISGYALLNPDEDIAETFVAFTKQDYPRGNTVLDAKIKFFYTNPTMVKEREQIRKNLGL